MAANLELRDGILYLRDPDGNELYFGPPFEDRLPSDVVALDISGIKSLLLEWEVPPSVEPEPYTNREWHRKDPLDQGSRGTCVCFALNAAIEGRLARNGRRELLSAQYSNWVMMAEQQPPRTWCKDTLYLYEGVEALHKRRVCLEADCRYELQHAPQHGGWCASAPSQAAHDGAVFGIADHIVIDATAFADAEIPMRLLRAGLDIAVAVFAAFGDVKGDRVHDAKPGPGSHGMPEPRGSHAMLIVGYGESKGIPYFECVESRLALSPAWSVDGLVRVSAAFLARHAAYGVIVTQTVG